MSFTEKRLCNPTQLTTSGQTLYTVPASKTAIIKQIVVTNVTGSAVTFSLYIGSASTANALFSGTSVAANDTVIINLSQVLSQNEILTSLASANSSLNITISGVENDGPLNPLSTYIADGAITSAKIADGAILNADINASAAIDKTKISGTAITAADTGTVTSTMILDGTIATADIANNAITQIKLDTSLPISGFRNAIINGGFNIWQRGTSVTPASGYGYTADRWLAYSYAASATTVSRVAFTAGTTLGLSQPQYHARVNSTSTAMYFGQRIEDVTTFAGQTITISFYAKHQSTFSVPIYIEQNFGSGGSANVGATGTTFSIGTSWQRYTHTLTLPSLSGKTIGTSSFLDIYLFSSAVNNYLDIWGFQVELGSQPTPFEQRPSNIEIQMCQRYFSKSFQLETAPVNGNGTGDNTGNNLVVWAPTVSNSYSAAIHFPVRMRRTPDVTLYNAETSTANTWSVYNSSTSINNSYSVIIGTRNERSMLIYASGITTITVSNGAWSASAEL